MTPSFWVKLNKPFTVLAPMANVTDWAFRQIVLDTGKPDVFYTEFVSADGICAIGPEKFKGELYFEERERPIVAQFFTANPEHMKKCAELAVKMGFDGIDINMGCPDKSVEKQGAGAALIKDYVLAKKIIKAAKDGAGKLPVSVKTRLGYNKIETDTWIAYLLETGISALVVHARTRKEMSAVPAHWDEMGKIVKMAKDSGTLIVGNGDVKDMIEVREKARDYGLDGIMVGRGIFTNPWFFNEKINLERIEPKERLKLLIKHCDNFEKLWGQGEGSLWSSARVPDPPPSSALAEPLPREGRRAGIRVDDNGIASNKNFDTLKRFFKIYINNYPGAKELRTKLMEAKNIKEVRLLAEDFLLT